MTSRDRFDCALEKGTVDRPPIFYQHLGAAKWILQSTGLTMRQGFSDPDTFAKLALSSNGLFGFDNVMAGWGDLLVEAQAHGLRWKFPEKDFYPRPDQYLDLSKIDEVRVVDPMQDQFWSVPLRAASLMQKKVGRDVKVFGCIDSPMLIACETVGMENFMMAQYTAKDAAERLVGTITESSMIYGEHIERIGLDSVFVDNSSAGMELNSLEACEQFDHRFLRDLIAKYRARGIGMVLHNDSVHPYLEKQLELNPKGIHFHLKSVDMLKTFDMLRGKTCVFAGIDHQDLLFQKTPADIGIEVERMMMTWGEAPGFVMAPGCELPYKTPLENIRALKEATIRYGSL